MVSSGSCYGETRYEDATVRTCCAFGSGRCGGFRPSRGLRFTRLLGRARPQPELRSSLQPTQQRVLPRGEGRSGPLVDTRGSLFVRFDSEADRVVAAARVAVVGVKSSHALKVGDASPPATKRKLQVGYATVQRTTVRLLGAPRFASRKFGRGTPDARQPAHCS